MKRLRICLKAQEGFSPHLLGGRLKWHVTLTLSAMLLVAGCAPRPDPTVPRIEIMTPLAPADPLRERLHAWAAKATPGDAPWRLDVVDMDTLVDSHELLAMLKRDQAKGGLVRASALGGTASVLQITGIPYLFSDHDAAAFYTGEQGSGLLREIEESGFVGLAFFRAGTRCLVGGAALPADVPLQGLRCGAAPYPLQQHVLRAMGLEVVPASLHRAEQALAADCASDCLDLMDSDLSTVAHALPPEVVGSVVLTGHTIDPWVLVLNQPAWALLADPARREALRLAAQDVARDQWAGAADDEALLLERMRRDGVVVRTPDLESLRAQTRTVLDLPEVRTSPAGELARRILDDAAD